VTVQAAAEGRIFRIAVLDNGPGLPPGDEERVFDKFYRASARADGGRGSGLGLAICRAVAKAHGGNVTAANRPSGGTELVIQLPMPKDVPNVAVE
jgi:two-component system sensor histidine kinase KdpD